MPPKILYIVLFMLTFPALITLLFLYSVHIINKDTVLKDMLSAAAASTDKDRVFILKKSFASQCFSCLLPLFSLMFLSAVLFSNYTMQRKSMYAFFLIFLLIGSVYSFLDYFLSRIVIVNGLMYIRCLRTRYKPVIITLDDKCKYEEPNVGPFGLFAARYLVSISTPLGSCVTNADNKIQLIETLNRINADQERSS